MKFIRAPRYYNEFVLTYRGYYGDGDVYLHESNHFDKAEEPKVLATAAAISLLMTHSQDFEELDLDNAHKKFKSLGLGIQKYDIPYNHDFDYVPTIDFVEVMFFDENGVGHTLSIES
jgi:hypothetical protein